MNYCRYCAHCFCGDWYYCSELDKPLRRVDKAVKCDKFELSELGDVDTGKQYTPRPRKITVGEQLKFE